MSGWIVVVMIACGAMQALCGVGLIIIFLKMRRLVATRGKFGRPIFPSAILNTKELLEAPPIPPSELARLRAELKAVLEK